MNSTTIAISGVRRARTARILRLALLALGGGILATGLGLALGGSGAHASEQDPNAGGGLTGLLSGVTQTVGTTLHAATGAVDQTVTAVVTPVAPVVQQVIAPAPEPVRQVVQQTVTTVTTGAGAVARTADQVVTTTVNTALGGVSQVAGSKPATTVVGGVVGLVQTVPVVGGIVTGTGLPGVVTGVTGTVDHVVGGVVGTPTTVTGVIPSLPTTGVDVIAGSIGGAGATGPQNPGTTPEGPGSGNEGSAGKTDDSSGSNPAASTAFRTDANGVAALFRLATTNVYATATAGASTFATVFGLAGSPLPGGSSDIAMPLSAPVSSGASSASFAYGPLAAAALGFGFLIFLAARRAAFRVDVDALPGAPVYVTDVSPD